MILIPNLFAAHDDEIPWNLKEKKFSQVKLTYQVAENDVLKAKPSSHFQYFLLDWLDQRMVAVQWDLVISWLFLWDGEDRCSTVILTDKCVTFTPAGNPRKRVLKTRFHLKGSLTPKKHSQAKKNKYKNFFSSVFNTQHPNTNEKIIK